MKRINIVTGLCFFCLIPVIIVVYSYWPGNRIRLAADSVTEYFWHNIACNLSLKLLIAIVASLLITLIGRAIFLKGRRS